MRVERAALFRAVVVAGAALTACARNEAQQPSKPPPAPEPRATAIEQPPVAAPSATADETASAVSPPPAAPSTGQSAVPASSAAPDAGVAKKPCPPGSEIPFPPCYHIR